MIEQIGVRRIRAVEPRSQRNARPFEGRNASGDAFLVRASLSAAMAMKLGVQVDLVDHVLTDKTSIRGLDTFTDDGDVKSQPLS
jgi:hypothetical protein